MFQNKRVDLGVLDGHECCGNTSLPSATSTSYSVSIYLNVIKHIIVDNMCHIWNFNTAACNICSNQAVEPLLSEISMHPSLPHAGLESYFHPSFLPWSCCLCQRICSSLCVHKDYAEDGPYAVVMAV